MDSQKQIGKSYKTMVVAVNGCFSLVYTQRSEVADTSCTSSACISLIKVKTVV